MSTAYGFNAGLIGGPVLRSVYDAWHKYIDTLLTLTNLPIGDGPLRTSRKPASVIVVSM